MSLPSTQTALELPSEARWHGVPRLLSQLSPELPTPWGCAGLTPTLPGRARPHFCCTQDPSAEVRRGEMGADFPEPSFKVDFNCHSCSMSESHLRWEACLHREFQGGQPPRGIATWLPSPGLLCQAGVFPLLSWQLPEARGKTLVSGQKLEGGSDGTCQGQKCTSCYHAFPSLLFSPASILRTAGASGQGPWGPRNSPSKLLHLDWITDWL